VHPKGLAIKDIIAFVELILPHPLTILLVMYVLPDLIAQS
jgi:hypothetical protein